MKLNYIIGLFLFCSFASCIEEGGNAIEGIGSNYIRIPAGANEINLIALDADPGVIKIPLMDVFKDANSQASMNEATNVKLKIDNSLITAYNTANGSDLVPLSGAYSIASLDVNIGSGESVKQIILSIEPSKLDLSKKIGLGISIESASGIFTPYPGLSSALFNIIIKNIYEGKYEVTGNMVDDASAALSGYLPMEYHLITSGANVVDGYSPIIGGNYVPILNAGSTSYYGSYGPVFTFDLATNKIISVTNIWGQPAGNSRSAELDPSGENKWNPDDRSINVKFFMKQPSVITTPPNIRVKFDWHLTYKGPL